MLLVWIKVGNKSTPILAEGMKKDELFPNKIKLLGVRDISESAFSNFKFINWSIDQDMVGPYGEGTLIEPEPKSESEPKSKLKPKT